MRVVGWVSGVGVLGVLGLAVPADAAKDVTLRVVITDAAGRPVPDAVLVVPVESERHRVNSEDGSWKGAALYLKDGTEKLLAKGDVVRVVAAAPGYAPTVADYTLKRRSNEFTLVLEPLAAPTLPCVPEGTALEPANGDALSAWAAGELAVRGHEVDQAWCLLGTRAYGEWLAWQAKSDANRAEGTMESAKADGLAQHHTREASLAWLEWSATNAADGSVAAVLCQVASHALEPCL